MKKISFVGLGKLGLPLATCFAKSGIKVLAIDSNPMAIKHLNEEGTPHIKESGLDNYFKFAKQNMTFAQSYEGVEGTEATIILVNTPSNKMDGSFSNLYVEQALLSICERIKEKPYHLIIISSTVMPGSIMDSFIPLIESLTNKKVGKDIGLCYIPDFVALGCVIKDFENPDMVIIGESDEQSGNIASELYKKIIKNQPNFKRIGLVETELVKVSLNAYVTMKISFANFLTRLCERFDADVDSVTTSLGFDKRISPYYIRGGMSFGGTCFPRDTWAFIKASKNKGLDAVHVKATQTLNDEQDEYVLNKVLSFHQDVVSVFGITFKSNSPVITESAGLKLVNNLIKHNKVVHLYDPIMDDIIKNELDPKVIIYSNFKDCFYESKLSVFTLYYSEFESMLIDDSYNEGRCILDCWGLLPKQMFRNIQYFRL